MRLMDVAIKTLYVLSLELGKNIPSCIRQVATTKNFCGFGERLHLPGLLPMKLSRLCSNGTAVWLPFLLLSE